MGILLSGELIIRRYMQNSSIKSQIIIGSVSGVVAGVLASLLIWAFSYSFRDRVEGFFERRYVSIKVNGVVMDRDLPLVRRENVEVGCTVKVEKKGAGDIGKWGGSREVYFDALTKKGGNYELNLRLELAREEWVKMLIMSFHSNGRSLVDTIDGSHLQDETSFTKNVEL